MSEPRTTQLLRVLANGPMTVADIVAKHGLFGCPYTAELNDTLRSMFKKAKTIALDGNVYAINAKGREMLLKVRAPRAAVMPECVVPPRITNVFSPEMKGYGAMLCANRVLREMPCKASGTSLNLYRGL